MSQYKYQVHLVSPEEYDAVDLGEQFKGGVVVDGCSGVENDCLLVTAHDRWIVATIREYPDDYELPEYFDCPQPAFTEEDEKRLNRIRELQAATRRGRDFERLACARIARSHGDHAKAQNSQSSDEGYRWCHGIAEAIEARGKRYG